MTRAVVVRWFARARTPPRSSHAVRVRARVPTEADPACERQTLDRIHSTRSTLADEARTNERVGSKGTGVDGTRCLPARMEFSASCARQRRSK